MTKAESRRLRPYTEVPSIPNVTLDDPINSWLSKRFLFSTYARMLVLTESQIVNTLK